jgi:hypothetical protein
MFRSLHSPFRLPFRIATFALTVLLFFPRVSPAQDLARRLILKDGSYQLVTKYEIKGDRVRYMSAERDDWEELPTSLVDWPATEKFEKERVAGSAVPEAVQLDKEIEHDRELEEAQLPQVAPGLRLPENSGVFLLDSFQGESQIVEVQQTAGDVVRGTKANVLRGALNPVAGMKQSIALEGAHAAVQSHVDFPALYIKIDDAPDLSAAKDSSHSTQGPQQPQQPQQAIVPFDQFRIVRTEVKGGKRIVGDVKRQVTGKISQEQHVVKTTIDRVTGGWLKLTPTESLPPGEYALVEMMGKESTTGAEGMNLYVWDFGVNPKAPANANPWKPTLPESKTVPKSDSDAKPIPDSGTKPNSAKPSPDSDAKPN